ncbi:MAG: TIGR04084 family radical SAM/SPASM domain-containing protein [Nitrososphaeria archaeon]
MLWLVYTTGECNLKCSYCGGSFSPSVVPWSVSYSVERLKSLIEEDDEAVVIFYGGEPLLNPGFIMKVMDSIRAKRFGVQTNGTLIERLPDEYWQRMGVVLLSMDGIRQVTDKYRGKGVYDKVLNALQRLKGLGLNRVIARMTATSDTDIYRDVTHLLGLGFDYVHWQLNAVWSRKWDIASWAEKSYLPGIKRLVELFLDEARAGRVLGIVPFLGILSAHFFGGYTGPPCGAGYRSISITTDGRVLACPIAVYEKWAVLGSIDTGFSLMKPPFPERCIKCPYLKYCGGRCLYSIIEGADLWGESFDVLDDVTRKTIEAVLSAVPKLESLIKSGTLEPRALMYDPVLDSTEVIP